MRWKAAAGQIVIPALLLFPTLFLFVYLIYETAKLSREKIRHQFAMDAAAFVEATNYSDFLNRTAYVNGAFPMRIFEEMYDDWKVPCEGKVTHCPPDTTYAKLLYENGIFPRSRSGRKAKGNNSEWNETPSWDIVYNNPDKWDKNTNPPSINPKVQLFSQADAQKYWLSWEMATEVYKLYVQVFSLLGSVEKAQLDVLKRLTEGDGKSHSFLQKSYWLNTGDDEAKGLDLANKFDRGVSGFKPQFHCVKQLEYYGNEPRRQPGSILEYRLVGTQKPVDLPDSQVCTEGGLFQMLTVDEGVLKKISGKNGGDEAGIAMSLPWMDCPYRNFFNAPVCAGFDTATGHPELHTRVTVGGHDRNQPAVWPNPTPKFQVRQFP